MSRDIATSPLLFHFPLEPKNSHRVISELNIWLSLNHVARGHNWLFPELPVGHREKGEREACFQDSDLLAPDHGNDTLVSPFPGVEPEPGIADFPGQRLEV